MILPCRSIVVVSSAEAPTKVAPFSSYLLRTDEWLILLTAVLLGSMASPPRFARAVRLRRYEQDCLQILHDQHGNNSISTPFSSQADVIPEFRYWFTSSPPVRRISHGLFADHSWLEAIQQAGFGLLHVSLHGLFGLCSVSMLQSLDNLQMLLGCHKTRIESQYSSHIFH
jgi:hypothetical protein